MSVFRFCMASIGGGVWCHCSNGRRWIVWAGGFNSKAIGGMESAHDYRRNGNFPLESSCTFEPCYVTLASFFLFFQISTHPRVTEGQMTYLADNAYMETLGCLGSSFYLSLTRETSWKPTGLRVRLINVVFFLLLGCHIEAELCKLLMFENFCSCACLKIPPWRRGR